MPAISNFIKLQKSKYVQAKKWAPAFYYKDDTDQHLYHPDIELLQLAEKACKYLYRGATFDSAAKWISHFATEIVDKRKAKDPEYKADFLYTLSTPGMKVFYRKWLHTRSEVALASRVKNGKKNKKDINVRLGNSVEAVGYDTVIHAEAEKDQAEKISA